MRKGNGYLKNKITAEFPHSREKSDTHSRQHKRLRKHGYAQSHPTLCDHMDCSPPGSSVHGILQARILEWVAMFSSRGSSRPRNRTRVSCLLHWQADFLPLVPHKKIKGTFGSGKGTSPAHSLWVAIRQGRAVRENQITLLDKERAAGTVLWPFWRKMALGAWVVEGGADGEEKRCLEKTCWQTPTRAGQPMRLAAGSAKGPEDCDA